VPWSTSTNLEFHSFRVSSAVRSCSAFTCQVQYSITFDKIGLSTFGSGIAVSDSVSAGGRRPGERRSARCRPAPALGGEGERSRHVCPWHGRDNVGPAARGRKRATDAPQAPRRGAEGGRGGGGDGRSRRGASSGGHGRGGKCAPSSISLIVTA
jgi:hypothetical protein